MPMKKALKFSRKDWIEIHCSLETKIGDINLGHLGAEINPGDNQRWIKHLTRIQHVIEKAGLA